MQARHPTSVSLIDLRVFLAYVWHTMPSEQVRGLVETISRPVSDVSKQQDN